MSDSNIERLAGGTHAVIDLDAYAGNIRALKTLLPAGTAFMAVVKADAYGHGAMYCAKSAIANGADWLGVARIHEGIRLRAAGITTPILVLGPPNIAEVAAAQADEITLAVGSESAIAAIADVARSGPPLRVHLKIDTGMHRYGVQPAEARDLVRRALGAQGVELDGIFTHFSSADERDAEPTLRQIERFEGVLDEIADIWQPRYVHAANSAAVLSGRLGATNLVRCGIATYGLSPSIDVPVGPCFRPILALQTIAARVFQLSPGDGVSYGLTYRAAGIERIATTPVGYADGLPRVLSNQGWFTWQGLRCPIRGRVCMDQTVVSVPSDVREGDALTIVGEATTGAMTLDDVARMSGTINYESATRVMARVPRIYVSNNRPIAWEHPSLVQHDAL